MLVKRGVIPLNSVEPDWFTVTSFSYRFYEYWSGIVMDIEADRKDTKLMQYVGNEFRLDSGLLRLLKGHQKGMQHWMVTCSGQLASMMFGSVLEMIDQDIPFKCTRLDVQCTIERPGDYDSVSLFDAIAERRRSVSYISSNDKNHGKLATVGVGNRSSQRYMRIYEKPLSDDLIGLRFEVEYKGTLANRLVVEFRHDREVLKESMLHELLKLKSKWMESKYYMVIDANQPRKVSGTVDKESKTKEWLIASVLPTLERVVRNHDDSGEIAQLFLNVIDNAIKGN